MRNLLNGLKGDLWNMAKRYPKENINWSIMAVGLAINGGSSTEHIKLTQQESRYSKLLSNLASILKDYEGTTPFDLDDIWIQSLLLCKLPQKVSPKSLGFVAEGILFEPQNSLFWHLFCCLHVSRHLVA